MTNDSLIDGLTAATTLVDADDFVVQKDGETTVKKVPKSLVKSEIQSTLVTDMDCDGNSILNHLINVKTKTGTSETALLADNNHIVLMNNASAQTLTLPNNMPVGWSLAVCWYGVGEVSVAAGSGAELKNTNNHVKVKGRYAIAPITCVENSDGSSAVYILEGNTKAT